VKRIVDELSTIAVAVQFLTRLPTPSSAFTPARLAASVRWYPLVGMLIGGIGAAAYWIAALVFPPLLAVLLATAITMLVTGAFHEDGLADLFDGLGASTRERMLEVMRDSRLGAFGAAALGLVLAAKVVALADLSVLFASLGLIAGHATSRFSSIAAIATSRYVRESGAAKPVAQGIGAGGLVVALVCALAALVPLGFVAGASALLCSLAGAAIGHFATRLLYERRLGGYTGDCLGAIQQLSELGFYLGLVACL